MDGSAELVTPEEVPRMALKEGSVSVERGKGKEFAREMVIVADILLVDDINGASDLEKAVATIINMTQKLMTDKAKHSADGDKFLCIFNDGKPIYTGKLAAVTDEIQKEKMGKAPVETGKAAVKIYGIPTEKMDKARVEAAKAVEAVGQIQLKKKHKALLKAAKEAVAIYKNRMERSKALAEPLVEAGKEAATIEKDQSESSKAQVEALETGEALVETGREEGVAVGKNQMDRCAESDPPAGVNGMYELSDDYINFILSMPKDTPLDDEDIPYMTSKYDMAKLMNRSEEWVEERRQRFKEDAALDQKIYDEFVPFQNWVRDEFFEKGYVEVDEEYVKQVAELEEYGRGLWDDMAKKHGGFANFQFADPKDPTYAEWYNQEEVCAL